MDNITLTNSICLRCQLAVAALARRREDTLRQRTPEDQNRAHYMRGTVMWHLHRVRRRCAHVHQQPFLTVAHAQAEDYSQPVLTLTAARESMARACLCSGASS